MKLFLKHISKTQKNKLKNRNKQRKRKELTPIILPKAPIQKQSKERAKPKKKASFPSIELEESKSDEVGFLIILMVIPKKSIKKL